MQKKHNSQFDLHLNSKSFGFDLSGREVFCYKLQNKNGFECEVINYGATITALKVPLSDKKKVDVVLGFEKVEDYIKSFQLPSPPYLGAIVGRFAGRIKHGQFKLNEATVQLNKNHGLHHLHGGFSGFSMAFWDVVSLTDNTIVLQYLSLDNEENFPGELSTQVTYTLTDDNELCVEMVSKTTKDTVINLTQHAYFNLEGHSQTIINQELFINSKKILELEENNLPSGIFFETENSKYDYYLPKPCPKKIDNTFVLQDNTNVAAVLFSKKNKLKMSVYTNQPAVHVYVGGDCFNQISGKENANYHSLSGICFETQNFPDAPNHQNFPNAILRKGETYHHQTIYKFENF